MSISVRASLTDGPIEVVKSNISFMRVAMKYLGHILMLCVCAAAVVICGALEPGVCAGAWLVLLAFLLPPAALLAALNSSGSLRAFWTGAASPALCAVLGMILVMISGVGNDDGSNGVNMADVPEVFLIAELIAGRFRMILLFLWSLMPLTGFICMIANIVIRPSTWQANGTGR